jgi:NifU-like protein involved in Fe-S cluster formation
MNAPLYTIEILRLAASLPDPHPLDRVDGSARERSPTCGSIVSTEVRLGADGRVEALSQQVSACAFGQASAALVANEAVGRSRGEVESALSSLSDWLAGTNDEPGDWPDLGTLAPARSRKSRHGAILLPFRALLSAMSKAG